ncbi:hypothetical protein [Halapricum sp. CBA1109]
MLAVVATALVAVRRR